MNLVHSLLLTTTVLLGLASFRPGAEKARLTQPERFIHSADTLKVDAETGLIDDPKLSLIKANCTGCHSTKLIQQHRFSREGWVGKIRWMQHNHNLWDLGKAEKEVLDYLEKYYSPQSALSNPHVRRAPLKEIQWYKL